MMKKSLSLLIFCICSLFLYSQNENNIIKIGSFNIQNFGKSKIANIMVVDTLVYIIRQHDLIAIQEISDVNNKVAKLFLNAVNDNGKFHYKLACSMRTGQQQNDKSSQEQYAFYYNSDIISLIDTSLYDDSKRDYFQREPFLALFKAIKGNFNFILCTIHTTPEDAVNEIASLYNVASWIPTRFKNSNNIIFCGDFNASCSYATPLQLKNLSIHNKPYNWIIPDTVKTNLSSKIDCAYDRFVVTDSLLPNVIEWSVFRYFKSKSVSDHWPISLILKY
jgi:endonuclease/exonuclease/phosphatase family metal-dependent hydrolase